MSPIKIRPEDLAVRDELLVQLINGATKAGVEPDHRKDEEKYRARGPIEDEE